MKMLKDLEDRLSQFDKTLNLFSDMIMASEEEIATQMEKDYFPLSVNRGKLQYKISVENQDWMCYIEEE